MGDVNDPANTAKTKFSTSSVDLSGVLRRRDVSWRHIGAVNNRYERVAKTLGATFVDPNNWVDDWDFGRDGLHIKRRGAPNEDMLVLEKLADRTGYIGGTTTGSVNGADLNLPYADWNGHAEKSRGTQVLLNRPVWENGYTKAVNSPTRGDALLGVCLVRPESSFTSCSNVQGVIDHCGVLLEAEWG